MPENTGWPPRSPLRFSAISRIVLRCRRSERRPLCGAAKMANSVSRTIPGNSLYPRHQPQRSGKATEFAPDQRSRRLHGSDAWERTAEMAVPAPLRVIACHRSPFPQAEQTRMGSHVSKSLDSFNCRRTLKVGGTEYVYYSLHRGREERPDRHFAAALFDEGAAGEPAAQRGRPLGHQGERSRPSPAG